VYRELRRGSGASSHYLAWRAQEAAERRARRSAANHPRKPAALWREVRALLRRDLSPEQARGRLARLGQPAPSVPAIYAHVRAERAHGGTLYRHLRFGLKRLPWGRHAHGALAKDRPRIHERPAHVALRQSCGHWEGDTLTGTSRVHRLLALVERMSRYLVLRRPGAQCMSHTLAKQAVAGLRRLPVESITFDNGSEFADYRRIAQALRCRVYFADPRRPNQRATCENTIGLIRQYIPKGTSGRHLSTAQIQSIADKLNHRPRKCLGYLTPHEVMFQIAPVALRT
jgi:IS30 family transposase